MSDDVATAFLVQARQRLTKSLAKIQHCVEQLSDEQVWWRPHESMNSIANIMLHLCGNLGQWILFGVGGTPDVRHRPSEFSERRLIPRDELLRRLEDRIRACDAVLADAAPKLLEPRRIQGFEETVLSAIWDSLTHLTGHTQEIIYITRLQRGERYVFQWVPATPEQGAAN